MYNGNVYPTLKTPVPNKGDSSLIYTLLLEIKIFLVNVATPLFGVSPRKFSWSHSPQTAANTIQIDALPSSTPPTQSMRHFRQEYRRSVYFRLQVHFLLFLFNEVPTSDAASTDVKGIFKSIPNTINPLPNPEKKFM